MIKVALKHFIYEICINQIFSGIFTNFLGKDTRLKGSDVKIGDKFSFITVSGEYESPQHRIRKTVYYNVEVTNVHKIFFVIKGGPFKHVHEDGSGFRGLGYDITHIYYQNILNFKR